MKSRSNPGSLGRPTAKRAQPAVLVVNGPNLNLLGTREPKIYGHTTLPEIDEDLRVVGEVLGVTVETFQSNHEGALVDKLHALADRGTEGFIVNFAAYSHTSIALHDALKSTGLPALEVHISDISQREKFRHHSMTAAACVGMISGHGLPGYVEALRRLAKL